MIPLIDLMPETSRKKLGQRRRTRRWVSLYGATLVAFAIAGVTLTIFEQTELAEVEHLRERIEFDDEQRRIAVELSNGISRYQARIDRHAELAWPIDVREILSVVGGEIPESVSLTSLAMTPRVDRRMMGARAGVEQETPKTELILEIRGVAPDDLEMSKFVYRLDEHPLFDRIDLDYARRATVNELEGREFGLTCHIDADAEYVQTEGGA